MYPGDCDIVNGYGARYYFFLIILIYNLTLIISFFLCLKGGAFDPGIDLLKGLNLHTNITQFDGVSITQGSQKRTAYKLQGNNKSPLLTDNSIKVSILINLHFVYFVFRYKPKTGSTKQNLSSCSRFVEKKFRFYICSCIKTRGVESWYNYLIFEWI